MHEFASVIITSSSEKQIFNLQHPQGWETLCLCHYEVKKIKVISGSLSQVVQIVQKHGKGLAAVHNKPEPPKTRNILVPRKVKAERSDTTEVDCDILYTHAVQHFLLFNTQVSEFTKF